MISEGGTPGWPRVGGAVLAAVAALSYSSFVLSGVTRSHASSSTAFISELETPGQPWSWLYRGSDVLAGVAMIGLAALMRQLLADRRQARIGCWLLLIVGISSVIDGATSMRCVESTNAVCAVAERTPTGMIAQITALHADSGAGGLLGAAGAAILLGAAVAGRSRADRVLGQCWIVMGVAIAISGLLDVVLLSAGGDIGVAERVRTALTSLWLLSMGDWLLSDVRIRLGRLREVGGYRSVPR